MRLVIYALNSADWALSGAAACDTSTGASGSFTRRTTLRELPVSKLYFSLTTRAAVSRVKSGPKAPPGRSCPMKIVPQKQVVPRSQVKAKAKPATKPRSPSTQPRSQPSSPRKRVVPRTAVSLRPLCNHVIAVRYADETRS